jgi:L-alanine-DL-glutamate epimerase-like enolase superfamily enzyme
VPAEQVAGVLARFPGCTTAKVKVAQAGQALRDDVDRVAAVRDLLGPTGRVRVDANGGWTLADARWAIAALAPYDLEYVEQPCATVDDLALLRVALALTGLDVLVAADESVRKAEDPLRVVRAGAADLLVLKVAPLGGVRRRWRSRRSAACRSWSRARWTPPSASGPASRWPPRCRTCRTPAGWRRPACSAATSCATRCTATAGRSRWRS